MLFIIVVTALVSLLIALYYIESRKNVKLTVICKNQEEILDLKDKELACGHTLIKKLEYKLDELEYELEECKHKIVESDSHLDALLEDKYKFKEEAESLKKANEKLLESIFELHKDNSEETFERIMRSIVFKKTGEQSPVEEHIEDDLDSIKDGLDCFKDSHASFEDDLACLDRCYMQTLYEAGED